MIDKAIKKLFKDGASKPKGKRFVNDVVFAEFDEKFYKDRYRDLDQVSDLANHYFTVGWKEGRDPTDWFSSADYLSSYPDVASSNVEPLTHYVKFGRREGRLISPAAGTERRSSKEFFEATNLLLATFPHDFDAELYGMAAGIPTDNRWGCLAHFVTQGIFNARLFAVANVSAELLYIIGESIERYDQKASFKVFQLAEAKGLSDPRLYHRLGDCYLSISQLIDAKKAYERSIELGGSYFWTYQNLGHVNRSLGYFEDAIVCFNQALEVRPDKYRTRIELRNSAKDRFELDWIQANGLSLRLNDDKASSEMAASIERYKLNQGSKTQFADFPAAKRNEQPKIAIFGSDSIPQCKLYRIKQKIDQFRSIDQEVDFFPLSQAGIFTTKVALYDIVIVYRAPATPDVVDVLLQAQKFNVCTFYDIDDLIFDDSCYPPTRESLKGMVSDAEYAGLVTGRVLFRQAMAMCDYGIASTPPLVDAIASVVRRKKCYLSRNALGAAHIAGMGLPSRPNNDLDSKVVLFYGSGSRSHNENFAVMAPALSDLLRRQSNCELHIVGPVDLGPEFKGLQRQIVRIPFTTDLKDYWRELARADINLAPLTSSQFNDAKSEIKWMEAGMLAIPSIVSYSSVYESVVENRIDGFIASSTEDWSEMLHKLVLDADLRRRVGRAALKRVREEYAVEKGAKELKALLFDGWREKKAVRSSDQRERPLILVVNLFYPPEYIGGATRVVEQSVEDLKNLYGTEFTVEVFCGREPDGEPGAIDRYLWNGVPVTSLSPHTDQDSIERSVNTAEVFDRLIDLIQPDLIHFHAIQRLGASLLDVAAARSIPHVVTVHDGWWISDRQFLIGESGVPVYESDEWGDPRRLSRLKTALNRADATLAVSASQGELYRSRGINNVAVLANGSETLEGVSPAPTDGPVWLGLLGGLGLAKGSDLLREVLVRRRYKNIRFLVVDHTMLEGTSREELWGDNRIEFIGKVSFAQVAKVYSRIHGLLAISVCVESFGLVAREARRLGRWVIASDRGGMAEDVVSGKNGFIVDTAKFSELMHVLDVIEADPELYKRPPEDMGPLRGRSEVASDVAKLYRRLLNDRMQHCEKTI